MPRDLHFSVMLSCCALATEQLHTANSRKAWSNRICLHSCEGDLRKTRHIHGVKYALSFQNYSYRLWHLLSRNCRGELKRGL